MQIFMIKANYYKIEHKALLNALPSFRRGSSLVLIICLGFACILQTFFLISIFCKQAIDKFSQMFVLRAGGSLYE